MKNILLLTVLYTLTNLAYGADDMIRTNGHSQDVPTTREELPSGVEYRENFMALHQISQYIKFNYEFFENQKFGLGLMKVGNSDAAFRDILYKTTRVIKKWKTGEDFLKSLVEYTMQHGCIPKLVSPSHGWSSNRSGDVHGLSGIKGVKDGLFATPDTQPKKGAKRSRNVSVDLKNLITQQQVQFCESCLIEIYACNVSVYFVKTLSKTTGCQVVAATGKASPRFQGKAKEGQTKEIAKYLEYNASHHWLSSPGDGTEYENETGVWVRATPSNQSGTTVENLGRVYLAL